jgi:hypothetical protein
MHAQEAQVTSHAHVARPVITANVADYLTHGSSYKVYDTANISDRCFCHSCTISTAE